MSLASLPSRGAWIEMLGICSKQQQQTGSLPSRGAWIEIQDTGARSRRTAVAPLTGSVDRNLTPVGLTKAPGCRSPHGERG